MEVRVTHIRRGWILAFLLGIGTCIGCDVGSLTYFLTPETTMPPLCGTMVGKDKKKLVRAMILVSPPSNQIQMESVQADRQLTDLLYKDLREQFKENEENVAILPPRKVEEYKSKHPGWKDLGPARMGKFLGVDWVIVLEMHSFTLKENGGILMRGRTEITASLVNVHQPEEAPERKEFNCLYPNESRGAVDVDTSRSPAQFRQEFLETVARRLTRYFAAYSPRERYDMEELSISSPSKGF